jgi:hypothetical protein
MTLSPVKLMSDGGAFKRQGLAAESDVMVGVALRVIDGFIADGLRAGAQPARGGTQREGVRSLGAWLGRGS